MCIAAVLAANQVDTVRVIFIQNQIIKNNTSTRRMNNCPFHVFPNNFASHFFLNQISIDSVVAKF